MLHPVFYCCTVGDNQRDRDVTILLQYQIDLLHFVMQYCCM